MQIYVRFSLGNMTELIAVDFFFPVSWYECGEGSTDSEIITERKRIHQILIYTRPSSSAQIHLPILVYKIPVRRTDSSMQRFITMNVQGSQKKEKATPSKTGTRLKNVLS